LLDALHEDLVWKFASRDNFFSFRGEHRGRVAVKEALSNISKDYTFRYMRPIELTSAAEVVWGLFDVELVYDAKGRGAESRPVQLEMAIRWKLKDGKIIEHHTFFDTAYLLAHQVKLVH
jgi:ketosteroid isomerase-like protein